jgi:methionyl-tRNA synthetase
MEIIRADVLARYHRLKEREVFFNTGTDEHGAKIAEAAEKEGIDPKSYTDRYAEKFRELKELLGLSVDNFVRTTDDHHVMAAQEFWNKCLANTNERGEPDIYKKLYRVKYCVGCELEKTDSELVDGKCPLHPNRELEIREEENYFFRWSRYQKPLLELYQEQPDFVIPDFRGNEVRAFVERGLEDFSISRLKSKMSWGVPVPGDEEHVMYV